VFIKKYLEKALPKLKKLDYNKLTKGKALTLIKAF
jgi:hypothetical protein